MKKSDRLAFEARVNDLLRQWTRGKKSQDCEEKIATALGCVHLSQGTGYFLVETPPQPDPALESIVLGSQQRLLKHHAVDGDLPFAREMD